MPDRRLVVGSTLAFAGVVCAVCFLRPQTTPLLPPCPFYALTGLYCPGCGSTRLLYCLVRGHPLVAFAQNPLAMVVLLPAVVYGLLRQLLTPSRPLFTGLSARAIWIFAAVVVAYGILRNLPFAPFSYLAPGGLVRFF